jgi:prepilin-type N-terminal cleavage/methylation domain-containing protein
MLRRRVHARPGVTLIEVVVAMVVAGVILSVVGAISVHQQRLLAEVADAVAVSGRLREISSILPIDLRAAAAAAGDVREATDTSIELRATIASAVVCDTSSNVLLLAPSIAGVTTYASVATPIDSGDTAWVFTPGDSIDEWRAAAVAAVRTVTASSGQCSPSSPRLGDSARALPRMALRLEPAPASARALLGLPVRVTRTLRVSLYRSSDAGWYVGEHDWNAATLRFNTIQPVSGPFLSAAAGGMTLTYLDRDGVRLPTPVADTRAIAAIRASFRGESKMVSTVLGSASSTGKRLDTSSVVTLLQNRR